MVLVGVSVALIEVELELVVDFLSWERRVEWAAAAAEVELDFCGGGWCCLKSRPRPTKESMLPIGDGPVAFDRPTLVAGVESALELTADGDGLCARARDASGRSAACDA